MKRRDLLKAICAIPFVGSLIDSLAPRPALGVGAEVVSDPQEEVKGSPKTDFKLRLIPGHQLEGDPEVVEYVTRSGNYLKNTYPDEMFDPAYMPVETIWEQILL